VKGDAVVLESISGTRGVEDGYVGAGSDNFTNGTLGSVVETPRSSPDVFALSTPIAAGGVELCTLSEFVVAAS